MWLCMPLSTRNLDFISERLCDWCYKLLSRCTATTTSVTFVFVYPNFKVTSLFRINSSVKLFITTFDIVKDVTCEIWLYLLVFAKIGLWYS